MTRLRLLKVIVQPVFVIDDGVTLRERPAQPRSVAADEWDDFVAGFHDSVEQFARRVREQTDPPSGSDP
jgi:hypothetical protein